MPTVYTGSYSTPGAPVVTVTPEGSRWQDLPGYPDGIDPGTLDHVGTALALLWKQFEATETDQALAEIIGGFVQQIEDVLADVWIGRSVEHAEGVALDYLGEVVGLGRDGLTDDEYKAAIRVEYATRFASGTVPEILDLIRALFPGREFLVNEYFPANLTIWIENLTPDEVDLFVRIMRDVPPAGVGSSVGVLDPGSMGGWGYDTPPDPELGSHGYSSGLDPAFSLFSYTQGF